MSRRNEYGRPADRLAALRRRTVTIAAAIAVARRKPGGLRLGAGDVLTVQIGGHDFSAVRRAEGGHARVHRGKDPRRH